MPGRTTEGAVETQQADLVSVVIARLGGDNFISAHVTSNEVWEQAGNRRLAGHMVFLIRKENKKKVEPGYK